MTKTLPPLVTKLLLGGCFLGMNACASSPPPPSSIVVSSAPAEQLVVDSLTNLAPSAALETLTVVRPAELWRTPSLRDSLTHLVPTANLDALTHHLGFDPRHAEELVFAEYGSSTLTLLRLTYDRSRVEARFRERLTSGYERIEESPTVVRVRGQLGKTKRVMAAVGPEALAFSSGDELPLRASLGFARGKLHHARAAFHTAPFDRLVPYVATAPLLWCARPSAQAPWLGASNGVLAHASAVALMAAPDSRGLRVRLLVAGSWDSSATEALRGLEALVEGVRNSPLGQLLHLHESKTPFTYQGNRDVIQAEGFIDPEALSSGLHTIVSTELRDLFVGGG